jgi:hypothetical protein
VLQRAALSSALGVSSNVEAHELLRAEYEPSQNSKLRANVGLNLCIPANRLTMHNQVVQANRI